MRISKSGFLGVLVLCGVAWAEEPIPVGEEFQVNSYTTSRQGSPAVAPDSQGNFVVVWQSYGSYGTDSDYYSVQAQRYDASGTPLGGQFQVNSYTTGNQGYDGPKVAVHSSGTFVVVWHSEYAYSPVDISDSIQAQRYDDAGTPVGGEFQVNSYTTGYQYGPNVAVDLQGNFVVVWESDGSFGTDTSSASIQAQRYDASGVRDGGEFQVNSYTTYAQRRPSVAFDSQGNFVVVWESNGSSGPDTSTSIQAQRYDATGAPVGGEFQINSYTTNFQGDADVAVDLQGNFVVVWQSYGSYGTDSSGLSIQAQRYDASGVRDGGEFQVNSYTMNWQRSPNVAVASQGSFVVVWQSDGSSGTDSDEVSVQGQSFSADGAPVGGQFQINCYTTDVQFIPDVAVDALGNFVVVWESDGSYGTDTSSRSVQGQRYATPIFADGFESGDTSAWSNAVP